MEWFAASGRLAVGGSTAIVEGGLQDGPRGGYGPRRGRGFFTDSLSMTDRDVVRNRGVECSMRDHRGLH